MKGGGVKITTRMKTKDGENLGKLTRVAVPCGESSDGRRAEGCFIN